MYPLLALLALLAGRTGESAAQLPKMVRTQGVPSGNVICELQDRAGNIWFSTTGEGLYRYDGSSFTNFTTANGLGSNDVVGIIETRSGRLLAATKRGIGELRESAFVNVSELDAFDTLGITAILESRDSTLWIGTMSHGVHHVVGDSIATATYGSGREASG